MYYYCFIYEKCLFDNNLAACTRESQYNARLSFWICLESSKSQSFSSASSLCNCVGKTMKNLKQHKADGLDDISMMPLNETAEQIAPAIMLLFQVSLNQGINLFHGIEQLLYQFFEKASNEMHIRRTPLS